MTTFALIHGAGDVAWSWGLVADELRRRGNEAVAVDLPCDDDRAGWSEYADTVVDAIGDRRGVTLVAHSLGGFTAPLVAARMPVDLIVLVAAMIPAPGETASEWWTTSGHQKAYAAEGRGDADESELFFHDVPDELAAEAMRRERDQSEASMREPWPLDAWPDVPTRFLLCRDDRIFPADWLRRHAEQRLGLVADEIDGGHCVSLSRPAELAGRLSAYAAQTTVA